MSARASAVRSLAGVDARMLGRDPMLAWLLFLPLGVALLLRPGLPFARGLLAARLEFELLPYYPLVLSSLSMMMPGLVGWVAGFLLLDQRDDRTDMALRVTPVPALLRVGYRLAWPAGLGLLTTMAMLAIVGHSELGLGSWCLVALAAAPMAPGYALFLAAFARNKVEGFALSKAVGVVTIPAVVAWWIDEPWQWLFGVVPHYWIAKLYWVLDAGDPGAAIYTVVAIGYQLLLIRLFLRRFERLGGV